MSPIYVCTCVRQSLYFVSFAQCLDTSRVGPGLESHLRIIISPPVNWIPMYVNSKSKISGVFYQYYWDFGMQGCLALQIVRSNVSKSTAYET